MNLRKRHQRVSAEVHTSAMNDIMFFLLLFFLIASAITNPNVIKLLLPKSSSGQAVSKQTVSVSISQDKKYTINNKPVKIEDMQTTLMTFKKPGTEIRRWRAPSRQDFGETKRSRERVVPPGD